MGLSNNAAEQISTTQVLIKLVEAIQNLDKKSIEQLSKDAYALPEWEQKKAEEARADIAKNQNLVAEYKDLLKEIEGQQDDIDKRAKEVKEAVSKLEQRKTAVETQENLANAKVKEQAKLGETLDARTKDLDKREAALKDGNEKLDARIKEFEAQQEKTRERAEEIKRLTEGL